MKIKQTHKTIYPFSRRYSYKRNSYIDFDYVIYKEHIKVVIYEIGFNKVNTIKRCEIYFENENENK